MVIFDAHIHAYGTPANPKNLIEEMDKAGVYGCCVFSNAPVENDETTGTCFDDRLNEVLSWQKGFEDRIFPVLWIHPFEENAIEKVKIAVDKGICAFKMICNNYYVSDEKSIALLKEIAKFDKPVFFHSGILWDNNVSSKYNRPINWECLIDIKGLRFSMGHCSWPWIDECIALYGKFMFLSGQNNGAEMYFDLTPGTPEIYRKELLTKLYTVGYDVGDNVMFGTDSTAHAYKNEWTKKWLEIDKKVLFELGVSKENLEKMYHKNLMRFLGKDCSTSQKLSPTCDDSNEWNCFNPQTAQIIEKWYKLLEFPKEYDGEFYTYLKDIKISDAITIENYNFACEDGARNLLSFLYLCEDAKNLLLSKGISENVIIDTLKDIVTWTKTYSNIKGKLYLGELFWLKRHLTGRIFRLGRLQFALGSCHVSNEKFGIDKGDNVIEVHIPEGEKLTVEDCEKSFNLAKDFFAEHFPEYKYEYFTCDSWLLDENLKKYLNENSNILKFASVFEVIHKKKSNALIKYLFSWDTTVNNIALKNCTSGFTTKIKNAIMQGESFYECLGVVKK